MKKTQLIIFFIFLSFISYLVLNVSKNQKKAQYKNEKFCTELNYKDSLVLQPQNFSTFNIDIEFYSDKKWKERIFKDEIQARKNKENSGFHTEFYTLKNRNKAIIYFNIPGQLNCKLVGNIRPHGDFNDHREGNHLPSLNINLKKGHIFGITKFILFRPIARSYENEIIATTILSEVKFLAPRSTFINVTHKGKEQKFIFQEKIVKEFIEHNSLREGPLYQGDERFIWWDNYEIINLSRHKLRNPNWARKTKLNTSVAEYGLSILNQFNQYFNIEGGTHNNSIDYYTIGKKLNKRNFESLKTFDSLMYAFEATHGLGRDDRRFYFDSVTQNFLPIYYDGLANILVKGQVNKSKFVKDEKIDLKRSNLKRGRVMPSGIDGAESAIRLIKKLNIKRLTELLVKRGVIINYKKVNDIKENIIFNLESLKNFNNKRIYKISTNLKKNTFMENEDQFNKNILRRFVYYDKNFNTFLNCDLFGNYCEELIVKDKQKAKLISQELFDNNNNNLIYVGKKKTNLIQTGWYNEDIKKIKKIFKEIDKSLSFYILGDVEYEIDKILKIIKFKRKNLFSKIVFSNGNLRDWKIFVSSNFDENNKRKYPEHDLSGLTGCLNLIDMEIENNIIQVENSNCEDAVNFIRTNGSIKSIKIFNSKHDALDADFSNIKFKSIEILKSENDCVDFSYGRYDIKNASINYCADKAISVGEKSILKIQDSTLSNSNIAIVSKDFSIVNILNTKMINNKYCYKSYNKKQEFSGASLTAIGSSCEKSDNIFYKDDMSELKIN